MQYPRMLENPSIIFPFCHTSILILGFRFFRSSLSKSVTLFTRYGLIQLLQPCWFRDLKLSLEAIFSFRNHG